MTEKEIAATVSDAPARQRRSWLRTPLDLPLALFLVSALIGVWAAYDRGLSWPLLATLAGSLALYWTLTWPRFDLAVLRRLAWLLVLAQGLVALYFITQFNHLDYPVKMGFVSRLGRLTGSLFPAWGSFAPQLNALATFMEGGLPLAVGLWWSARHRRERLAATMALALLGYGLLLTASRGAWMALAVCAALTLIVWGGRRLSNRRRWMALGALLLVALVMGAGIALVGPDRVPGLASALARASDRLELYQNSLHLIGDYPLLGIGLGDTFAFVYSKYILLIPYAYLTYAHNLPLSIWLNQGLLGLVSFGWLVLAFYGLVAASLRRGQQRPLFWGSALGVTAMLFHGLTDARQYADSRWVMPVFFALLGLGVSHYRVADLQTPQHSVPRPQIQSRQLRIAFVTLIATAVIAATAPLLRSTFYANMGAIYQTRADLVPELDDATRQAALDRAARYYRQALETDGKQPVAHWRLGLIDLNADRFPQAVAHLEIAHAALPGHRGVQKALGYAYLWDGQIGRAEKWLRPLDEVSQELNTWQWWRGEQGQDQLAAYAGQLASRLRGE